MQLTEEQRKQIDFALDMLLCAMRAANWEGDAAYIAGEKARALLAAHNAGAQTHKIIDDGEVAGYVMPSASVHPQPMTDAARDESPKEMLERMYREMKAMGPFEQMKLQLEAIAEIDRLDRVKGK